MQPAAARRSITAAVLASSALQVPARSLGDVLTLAGAPSDPPPDAAAGAAEAPARGPGAEGWWGEVDLSLWLPGISGTIGVRDVTANVNEPFGQILKDSDSVIGIAGAGYVGKGKLGGYVDGFWTRISTDASTPLGTADFIAELGIIDFGVSYEVGRWPMEWTADDGRPARDLVLVGYTGGRYTSVDIEARFPAIASRRREEGWVDPMLGARLELPLLQEVSLAFRGDIGGFGAASDLAWTAIGAVQWDFHLGELPSSLALGYIAVGDDFTKGSGADRFEWDVILHGLVLNWGIKF